MRARSMRYQKYSGRFYLLQGTCASTPVIRLAGEHNNHNFKSCLVERASLELPERTSEASSARALQRYLGSHSSPLPHADFRLASEDLAPQSLVCVQGACVVPSWHHHFSLPPASLRDMRVPFSSHTRCARHTKVVLKALAGVALRSAGSHFAFLHRGEAHVSGAPPVACAWDPLSMAAGWDRSLAEVGCCSRMQRRVSVSSAAWHPRVRRPACGTRKARSRVACANATPWIRTSTHRPQPGGRARASERRIWQQARSCLMACASTAALLHDRVAVQKRWSASARFRSLDCHM